MGNCKCNGKGMIEDINGINIPCSCGVKDVQIPPKPVEASKSKTISKKKTKKS